MKNSHQNNQPLVQNIGIQIHRPSHTQNTTCMLWTGDFTDMKNEGRKNKFNQVIYLKWMERRNEENGGWIALTGSTFFIINWNEEVESFVFFCCCYFSHFKMLFSIFNFASVVVVVVVITIAATVLHVALFSLFIWKLTDDPSTFGRLFHFMLAMNNIFKTIKRKRTVATVIFIYWIGFDPICVARFIFLLFFLLHDEYWSFMYIHHPSFISANVLVYMC